VKIEDITKRIKDGTREKSQLEEERNHYGENLRKYLTNKKKMRDGFRAVPKVRTRKMRERGTC